MIDKSDRTVRQWQTDLVANDGSLPRLNKASVKGLAYFGTMKH